MRVDQVPVAFDAAARGYDGLVGMNPGYHRDLRRAAAKLRIPERGRGARLLDLGCGTGASTAALLSVAPEAEITGVDASAGMIARARAKDWPESVRFVNARAEDLAEEGPFDGIFAAYLVRNLAEPDPVLRAVHDLLKPGAAFVAHDYSVRDSWAGAAVWTAVCWSVIIPAGAVVTRDPKLYTYLWRSALRFDGAGRFRDRLRRTGFTAVSSTTAGGWQRGIAHTFRGVRA
ncbi:MULTISPECIES: class I SAM-dependent methyltransferase [Actinosynnema]|uniref:class I SAM-dependent methyltransferase n=1 Tax=Actinosynnema TaxID=40566 RepID=UPI0020A54C50|nr:class I SAM-dependent methyltransferase [Actinosynnema pretiosum]MCP2098172.1 Ubiquinone/menaquinone biosynthesis C-methylase UbiE [Actinosynnema pretiosum]